MSVVFEYVSRNYIYDYEYALLKPPIIGGELSRFLIQGKSHFRHRAFLMFRQKWFLLLCVMQSEPMRTENTRLRLPIENREVLRKTVEKTYQTFGFDREAEWRLLDTIRSAMEPSQAESVANSLGSFDIHLVDGLSLLLNRGRQIQKLDAPERYDLAFEVATFSHLGQIFKHIDEVVPQVGELLIPYMQFKYGLFFLNLKYPISALERAIQSELYSEKASVIGMKVEPALACFEYLNLDGLPSALLRFTGAQRT